MEVQGLQGVRLGVERGLGWRGLGEWREPGWAGWVG